MKKSLIFLFIVIALLYSGNNDITISGDKMLPTDNNASSLFKNMPINGYSQSSTLMQSDGTNKPTQLDPTNIETTKENVFGQKTPSGDMYFGDPAKADKYFQENRKGIVDQATGFANDMRSAAPNKYIDKNGNPINNMNPNSFSRTAIKNNFEAENVSRSSLFFIDDMYKKVRSQMYANYQIKCYITRKLNNSYMCPIQSLNVATYGGGGKDSSEEAKKACDDGCKIHTKCLPLATNQSLIVTDMADRDLPIENFQMELNPEQVTKYFTFTYETIDLNDIQESYFEEDLVRSRINLVALDKDGNYITLYNRYVYKIKKGGGTISLPIMKNVQKIFVYFYNSYIFDPRYINEVALYGDNPIVRINNIDANYISNNRYFCPITQFVSDARKCDGKLLNVPVGGGYKTVCVKNDYKKQPGHSTIDGGYYFESQCDNECWDTKECVPTYRHLGNFSADVNSKYYDLEFGCVDSDDNLGCTEEKCKDYFMQSIQPAKEIVWEKDNKIAVTVNNGIETNIPRPKVDFSGELSTNGGDKSELFTQEMKDSAYKYMVDNQTYNVTNVKMGDSIPAKMAADVRVNDITQQISFNLQYKPASDDVDAGKTVHLYPVMQLEIAYKPIEPVSYNGQTYYPNELDRLRSKDVVFLTKNVLEDKWYVFRRDFNVQYYLPVKNQDGTVEYKWVNTSGVKKITYDMYDYNSKKFLVYSPLQSPANEISFTASSNKPWEDIMLFYSLKAITEQEGVMFDSQTSKDGKVYDNTIINDLYRGYYEGYRMYVVSATNTMSFSTLANGTVDSNLVYDSKSLSKSKVSIAPDTTYADGRVQLFILGRANNKSAFMKLVPDSTEVEKKGIIFMLLHE